MFKIDGTITCVKYGLRNHFQKCKENKKKSNFLPEPWKIKTVASCFSFGGITSNFGRANILLDLFRMNCFPKRIDCIINIRLITICIQLCLIIATSQ